MEREPQRCESVLDDIRETTFSARSVEIRTAGLRVRTGDAIDLTHSLETLVKNTILTRDRTSRIRRGVR